MIVPNFKILGTVVPEKSLTKKRFTHTHTEKAKTIYPLYTSYTGGIIRNRILKFSIKLGYEKLKGVIENHALLLIISFIYPFFFFSNKKSVSDFPSSILIRVFKFCIHPESV